MRLLEDGEDGANGDKAVNVGASIQRVEADDIFSLTLCLHLYFIVILLQNKNKYITDKNERGLLETKESGS